MPSSISKLMLVVILTGHGGLEKLEILKNLIKYIKQNKIRPLVAKTYSLKIIK